MKGRKGRNGGTAGDGAGGGADGGWMLTPEGFDGGGDGGGIDAQGFDGGGGDGGGGGGDGGDGDGTATRLAQQDLCPLAVVWTTLMDPENALASEKPTSTWRSVTGTPESK